MTYPGKVVILQTHMPIITLVYKLVPAHLIILMFVAEIQVGVSEQIVALSRYFIPKSHD